MIVDKIDTGVTRWSKIGAIFLAGWFLSSAYHGTRTAEKAVKAVPALEAQAGCEHWRSHKAEVVAKQAITAANSDTIPVPDAKAIPKDNCEKAGVPPAANPVPK